MKKFLCISIVILFAVNTYARKDLNTNKREIMSIKKAALKEKHVHKKTLSNGMTVLVRPVHTVPHVSMQIWYNVGSKDEKIGEKGIAHLIEHMIFKGTNKLSETDIQAIMHIYSGSTNAFTSYDYTGYLFNVPVQYWQDVLPIMADTMLNASFKEDHLSSEMKAVIQELKLYRDDYQRTLALDLISTLFPEHPYHHPIIGYKQDLFDVNSDDLRAFYKKHYWPNNATLVVVGDVEPEAVFKEAEKFFGTLPAKEGYKKEEFYFNPDIVSKELILYRDVKQPVVANAFIIPGSKEKIDPIIDVLTIILGAGKGSRLYKRLVDQEQLVTSFGASPLQLFDHGVFFLIYEPKKLSDVPRIEEIIFEELDYLANKGPSKKELERAIKNARMHYYSLLESNQKQASEIGKAFVATGDEEFAFSYLDEPTDELIQDIKNVVGTYFRPTIMHRGKVLPLPESEKKAWLELQKESDKLDTKIMEKRVRQSDIEAPSFAKNIKQKEIKRFDFPKAQSFVLPNDIDVMYYENKNTPKVTFIINLKADIAYDWEKKPGIYNFMTSLLTEGTKKYTGEQLADELESRGISLSITPGGVAMEMLADDFEKALELLQEVLTHPRFDQKDIEKVRAQMLANIKNFWDDPKSFSGQLIREAIYQGHPYSKRTIGTEESIASITKKDIEQAFKQFISPSGATIAVVGDISKEKVQKALDKTLAQWHGEKVPDLNYPALKTAKPREIIYPINRDQVVLAYAGLSVDRKHPDYDKLVLFDQIFGGGVLGPILSRLFQLRERTGAFYTISGSTVAQSGKQPGLTLVKTIVSNDRLEEAEKLITTAIDTTIDTMTPEELELARNAIVNSMVTMFASNSGIARAFLFLDEHKFPADYFDKRAQQLASVSLDDIKKVVKKYLGMDKMITVKTGRLEEAKPKKCA